MQVIEIDFHSIKLILNFNINKILDRFYWVSLDPVNVAEGLFAIANIFSFSRICFLLPAIQHLGPLQISLGRMMSVCIIFKILFCCFSKLIILGYWKIYNYIFDYILWIYVWIKQFILVL